MRKRKGDESHRSTGGWGPTEGKAIKKFPKAGNREEVLQDNDT